MHNAIVKFIKYLLRTLLWIILVLLVFWLSKSNRSISTYIGLLNQTNISDFKWFTIFQSKSDNTWDMIIPPVLNSDKSWFKAEESSESREWLDVYDPQFEQDMQDMSLDSILSGEEEGYGFKEETNKATVTPKTWNIDAQQKLIELINKNEMKK